MTPAPKTAGTRTRPAPLPRIPRSVALIRTGVIGLVLVVLIFGGLTLQMARGQDPALGARVTDNKSGSSSPATSTTPGGQTVVPQVQTVQPSMPAPAPVQTGTS